MWHTLFLVKFVLLFKIKKKNSIYVSKTWLTEKSLLRKTQLKLGHIPRVLAFTEIKIFLKKKTPRAPEKSHFENTMASPFFKKKKLSINMLWSVFLEKKYGFCNQFWTSGSVQTEMHQFGLTGKCNQWEKKMENLLTIEFSKSDFAGGGLFLIIFFCGMGKNPWNRPKVQW